MGIPGGGRRPWPVGHISTANCTTPQLSLFDIVLFWLSILLDCVVTLGVYVHVCLKGFQLLPVYVVSSLLLLDLVHFVDVCAACAYHFAVLKN